MEKTYIFKSKDACKQFAQRFAKTITQGVVLALSGDLGSGKTTFTQGLAKGLGIKEKVNSPTFVLMKNYQLKAMPTLPTGQAGGRQAKSYQLVHIDCYRFKSIEDALSIGLTDYLNDPNTICVIEWPEVIKKILPKNTIWLFFSHINENSRKLTIIGDDLL